MYLRVSLTDRCNLRCIYCLPADARFAPERAASTELNRLVELLHVTAGVYKIRLTGGEPTLCDDLVDHVRAARALVPIVGLTTNGLLLKPLLPALADAGLNRLNISLDALTAEQFQGLARRDGLDAVVGAIRAAQRLDFTPLKINTVAMQQTDLAALVRFAAWEGVHLRFIELMAIGEARPFQAREYVSATTMRERLLDAGIRLTERCDRDEPTSRVWAIDDHDVGTCSVGFITTISAPFCATCDRLRLSSQGRLYTCLMDNRGVDLLGDLRRGDEAAVVATIRRAVGAKRPPNSFIRHENMAAIGG
jgi:cyclic pyranopterin phosphate synthase